MKNKVYIPEAHKNRPLFFADFRQRVKWHAGLRDVVTRLMANNLRSGFSPESTLSNTTIGYSFERDNFEQSNNNKIENSK